MVIAITHCSRGAEPATWNVGCRNDRIAEDQQKTMI